MVCNSDDHSPGVINDLGPKVITMTLVPGVMTLALES